MILKILILWNSLAGQWLGLCTHYQEPRFCSWSGNWDPTNRQHGQKKKKKSLSCDPSKLTLVLVAFYRLFGIFLNTKSCYLWIDSLVSFYQIYVPFISFSCFITLARMSSTLLNWTGRGTSLHWYQSWREKHSVFHYNGINCSLVFVFL